MLKIPKESEAAVPSNINPIPGIIHAFFLDHFILSIKYDAITSINEIADVTAAKNTSRKKNNSKIFTVLHMVKNVRKSIEKQS